MKKAIFAYILTAGAALAHPGHDAASVDGSAHWLTQTDHIAVLVALGAFGLVAVVRLLHSRRRASAEAS